MLPRWAYEYIRAARLNSKRVHEDYDELSKTDFGRRVIADLLYNFDYGVPSFRENSMASEVGGFMREGQKSVLEYILDKIEPEQPEQVLGEDEMDKE